MFIYEFLKAKLSFTRMQIINNDDKTNRSALCSDRLIARQGYKFVYKKLHNADRLK